MKLYQLSDRYITLEGMLDSEDITKEDLDTSLVDLKDQIEDKVENIGKLVLTLKANAETLDAEVTRLSKRKQAIQSNIDRLKAYLLTEMIATDTLKVKRNVITVSVIDNPPSIELLSLDDIPQEFRNKIPESWQPDKKAMLDHFKATGEIVSGIKVILDKKRVDIK